jgi:hypothetical protein
MARAALLRREAERSLSPNILAGLRARLLRLGGFTRPFSRSLFLPLRAPALCRDVVTSPTHRRTEGHEMHARALRASRNTKRAEVWVGARSVQIKPDTFALPRCTSTELFFSCCGSVAALASANCNEHVAEANITVPVHTQRALHGAQSSKGRSGKLTYFSLLEYTRACSPPLFFRVLPPPGCSFARDCAHAGGPVR